MFSILSRYPVLIIVGLAAGGACAALVAVVSGAIWVAVEIYVLSVVLVGAMLMWLARRAARDCGPAGRSDR